MLTLLLRSCVWSSKLLLSESQLPHLKMGITGPALKECCETSKKILLVYHEHTIIGSYYYLWLLTNWLDVKHHIGWSVQWLVRIVYKTQFLPCKETKSEKHSILRVLFTWCSYWPCQVDTVKLQIKNLKIGELA